MDCSDTEKCAFSEEKEYSVPSINAKWATQNGVARMLHMKDLWYDWNRLNRFFPGLGKCCKEETLFCMKYYYHKSLVRFTT
jgi:hypothetical protein